MHPRGTHRPRPTRLHVAAVALVAAASAALVAVPAAGQSVDVTVSMATEHDPISVGGTLVLALDSLGTVRASGATTEGRRQLSLPWGGRWTIKAEHLGFGTALAEIEVSEGAVTKLEIELQPAPLLLDGIEASTESLCGPESRAPGLLELWSTARALLTSVAGGTTPRRFRVATSLLEMESGAYYHKDELRDGESEYDRAPDVERDTSWVEGPTPFPVEDPRRILSEGFVLPTFPGGEAAYLFDFHAPQPALLLSDDFIATHCFRFAHDPEFPGVVGLGFEPNRAGVLEYDVRGVLWLPQSADLWPWIDFRWTRIPEEGKIRDYSFQPYDRGGIRRASSWLATIAQNDERFGGRIDLAPLADAGWIVTRLRLQTPDVRKSWTVHLKAGATEKAYTPDLIRGRDLTRSFWWLLYEVHEFEAEVLSVQIAGSPGVL